MKKVLSIALLVALLAACQPGESSSAGQDVASSDAQAQSGSGTGLPPWFIDDVIENVPGFPSKQELMKISDEAGTDNQAPEIEYPQIDVVSPATKSQSDPVRVLVMGDSLIWGQGLKFKHKYTTLVSQHIADTLNRDVEIVNYSHSGALIEDTSGKHNPVVGGEVPTNDPDILGQQLQMAMDSGRKFDLVLIEGCINDESAEFGIILDVEHRNLDVWVQRLCKSENEDLLMMAHEKLGKPKIVVTGYYQIISEDSLIWLRMWVDRTNKFLEVYYRTLNTVIGRVDPEGKWATVINPDFKPENAFLAPDTLLWDGINDEVKLKRYRECNAAYAEQAISIVWYVACIVASMAHPNVKGAQKYTDVILADAKFKNWLNTGFTNN